MFVKEISRADLTDNGAEITIPVISLKVITGADFEAAEHTYGNFRITVTVVLSGAGGEYPTSKAMNYVIYTNAKVVPSFITNNN